MCSGKACLERNITRGLPLKESGPESNYHRYVVLMQAVLIEG